MTKREPTRPESLTVFSRIASCGDAARGLGLREMMRDSNHLSALHELCTFKGRFYAGVVSFLMRSQRRPLMVLVDFDVIYAYITGGTAGEATSSEIEYFFQASGLPFAIPTGAFKELEQFIEEEIPVELTNRLTDIPASLKGFYDELVGHANELAGRRTSRFVLDKLTERVVRIVEILGSERFCGVVGKYDNQLKTVIQEHLDDIASHRYREPRDENNQRDAQNLAIVASQYIADYETEHPNCWYLLLSATTGVKKAAKSLYYQGVTKGNWLTITPTNLVISEMLEFTEDADIAMGVARSVSEDWRRLERLLYEQYSKSETERQESNIEAIAAEVKSSVQNLLHREQAVKVEKIACQLPSIKTLQYRQGVTHGRSHVGESSSRSECLRALDALRGALSRIDPPELNYDRIAVERDGDHSIWGVKPSEASFGEDVFLTVQSLPSTVGVGAAWVRWDICCDDNRFVNCLDSAKDFEIEHSESAEPLVPQLIDDGNHLDLECRDGIVVSTSLCSVWLGFNWLLSHGGWDALLLGRIHKLLMEYGKQFAGVNPGWRGAAELVQELSIRRSGIRVIYEVVPKDHGIRRQMSVFVADRKDSKSSLIAHLYDWTGMRFAFRPALAKSIKSILEG